MSSVAPPGGAAPVSRGRDRQSRRRDGSARRPSESTEFPERRGTRLVGGVAAHVQHARIRPESSARVLVADEPAGRPRGAPLAAHRKGYEPDFVSSTDAVLERLRAGSYDLLLMDLNYSRDTTSGREGSSCIAAGPRARRDAANRRDDRVGKHRHGGRSDAARGEELRAEAVGGRALLEIVQRELADGRAVRSSRDARQQRESGGGAPDPARD